MIPRLFIHSSLPAFGNTSDEGGFEQVWGLLDLKGCEWLNKKAILCRGEFTPGPEGHELTQKCLQVCTSSHFCMDILNYFCKLKFGF